MIAHSNGMTTIELPPTSASATFTASTSASTPTSTPTAPLAPAPITTDRGWHDDPFDQHALRFHDGNEWTEHVTHHGPVPCQGCHPYAR